MATIADNTRTASVRFVGLLDTVGFFFIGRNEKKWNWTRAPPQKVLNEFFHITAIMNDRTKFPLTSLKQRKITPNFYEEVFPGAHSDVGGGLPLFRNIKATELAPVVWFTPLMQPIKLELRQGDASCTHKQAHWK